MQVSVIIPVYNAAPFIDQSIKSALDQRQTGEVLVIDDRSTDDSWAKCVVWAQKDPRVRLFKNNGPKGPSAARNVGLRHASCEYISFLDADDYYLVGRFEGDDKLFKSIIDIDGIINHLKFSTPSDVYINHNAYINGNSMGPASTQSLITPFNFQRHDSGSIITLTIKKDILRKAAFFDETLQQSQDTDFIFNLVLNAKIYSGWDKNPVAVYRRHNNNSTLHTLSAVYFRRKAAKKHFHLAIQLSLPLKGIWLFFLKFVEYDFLWLFTKTHRCKKGLKILLAPYFVWRIISKNDPPYDKNKKIKPF